MAWIHTAHDCSQTAHGLFTHCTYHTAHASICTAHGLCIHCNWLFSYCTCLHMHCTWIVYTLHMTDCTCIHMHCTWIVYTLQLTVLILHMPPHALHMDCIHTAHASICTAQGLYIHCNWLFSHCTSPHAHPMWWLVYTMYMTAHTLHMHCTWIVYTLPTAAHTLHMYQHALRMACIHTVHYCSHTAHLSTCTVRGLYTHCTWLLTHCICFRVHCTWTVYTLHMTHHALHLDCLHTAHDSSCTTHDSFRTAHGLFSQGTCTDHPLHMSLHALHMGCLHSTHGFSHCTCFYMHCTWIVYTVIYASSCTAHPHSYQTAWLNELSVCLPFWVIGEFDPMVWTLIESNRRLTNVYICYFLARHLAIFKIGQEMFGSVSGKYVSWIRGHGLSGWFLIGATLYRCHGCTLSCPRVQVGTRPGMNLYVARPQNVTDQSINQAYRQHMDISHTAT